jgi:pantothenate kinase
VTAWDERALRARMDALLAGGERRILGLTGPPGAGKSTLALHLHVPAPQHAAIVPMDGFHLANVELARLGRAGRKGAEDIRQRRLRRAAAAAAHVAAE